MNDTRLCCRRHEVRSATFAEELEGLQRRDSIATTSRCGEGTEHHQCHRTPRRSSSSSTLIMNRLPRSNRQRTRSEQHCMVLLVEKSTRNVCRVSRSTKLKLRPSLTLKRRKLQRSRTRFKRRRIHLKHSNIDQAEMQQEWRDSVKVQAAEDTRADENAA